MPRAVGQEPLYYDALATGRPAEGVDLTHPPGNSAEKYVSRYIDEPNTPLFPFGYGLSYTRFSYSPVKLSTASASARAFNAGTGAIRVSAVITNSGTRPGRETVQLYIRQRGTSVARPLKELKGFQILQLAPGESRQVEFTLGREQLAFWNLPPQQAKSGLAGDPGLPPQQAKSGLAGDPGLEMRYQVEPAQVSVWIAPNSADGTPAQFIITQ
jgi:beta-glucosidase